MTLTLKKETLQLLDEGRSLDIATGGFAVLTAVNCPQLTPACLRPVASVICYSDYCPTRIVNICTYLDGLR